MKTNKAVREIMKIQKKSVGYIKDKINQRNKELGLDVKEIKARNITDRLTQENISVAKLREMLIHLDYKIVLVPFDKKLNEGEYEIE
jgi:hypothetical protein